MLIRVSRPVVSVSIETFPLVRQWNFNDSIGERVSAGRVHRGGRPSRLVETGFVIHLMGGDLVSCLLHRSRVGRGGVGPAATLVGPAEGSPSISFFFISSFFLRRAWISCSFFWVASSVFLFISTISLCKHSSNIALSASVILSMLLVETIYFLSSASFSRPHGGCQLFLLGR